MYMFRIYGSVDEFRYHFQYAPISNENTLLTQDHHYNDQANRGWDSTFSEFERTHRSIILSSLRRKYPDSSKSEMNSWNRTVPRLQDEIGEVIRINTGTTAFTAVLEYELPMESRRADAVLLLHDGVVVIELKGKSYSTDADIDQTHAYARDLRCYHRDCHNREVVPVLVPERMPNGCRKERNVYICSPNRLDSLVECLSTQNHTEPINPDEFLKSEAYKPLPSLVRAARELFAEKKPPQLWRSVANTDNAVTAIRNIVADAYNTKTRRLILLTGVPGAGKTLVGLRLVHLPDLDHLTQNDTGIPSVFLSGNGPLVEVLQYVLKTEDGTGKTFVRPIRDYVKRYKRTKSLIPPEHVVVFDEAQRAHDRDRVQDVHKLDPKDARSEPEYFIDFSERVPNWSVVVGLVGGGQEIHTGEESGMRLWADAISQSSNRRNWIIHGPTHTEQYFSDLDFRVVSELNLDQTIRSHFASRLHEFVAMLVEREPESPDTLKIFADELESDGHDLRITRNLETAKRYLRLRYHSDSNARYGLVASSRDKDLVRFDVANDFQSTKQVKFGPWYSDTANDPERLSCRHLEVCVTEFGAQGLELDAVLLAWGTDFVLKSQQWSIDNARKYRIGNSMVQNPFQLRANAYRVLLTRGRDAHVVFIPPLQVLDETWEYLCDSGFRSLDKSAETID